MQFLAREKRGGLAACLLRTCVIGGGGVVALSEGDLVIRSSHARLGVLLLGWPGHVARCLYWDIRATCYVTASAAAVAFLLGRPPRAGFMSGSFSARNPENLAAFSFRTICPQEGRRGAREVGRGLETRAAGRLRAGGASASAPAAKPRLRQAHHGERVFLGHFWHTRPRPRPPPPKIR